MGRFSNKIKIYFVQFILLISILGTTSFTSHSQLVNPFGAMYLEPGFGLEAGFILPNIKHGLFDFGLGYDDSGLDFSAYINFAYSPSYIDAMYETSNHYFQQVKEKGYVISLDIEKRFYFIDAGKTGKYGLYAGLKTGWYWSSQEGLSRSLNQRFLLSPGGGISVQPIESLRLSAGYLYFNGSPGNIQPHSFTMKLNVFFNRSSGNKNDE